MALRKDSVLTISKNRRVSQPQGRSPSVDMPIVGLSDAVLVGSKGWDGPIRDGADILRDCGLVGIWLVSRCCRGESEGRSIRR